MSRSERYRTVTPWALVLPFGNRRQVESEALELLPERFPADPEDPGRLRPIPARKTEDRKDVLALRLVAHLAEGARLHVRIG